MLRFAFVLATALSVAACSGGGGSLAPALTARMDQPGAQLDRGQALMLINSLRATRGAAPLTLDASLNQKAQAIAEQYASSGQTPQKPGDVAGMRVSAGYANFAETFSGWRSTEADASALVNPGHRIAGIGVAYNGNSTYGTHWVVLFDTGTSVASAQ